MSKDADILQRIGAAIRQKRLEVGLSQDKLAQTSGVGRSFIINVERGDTNLSVLTLCQITNALEPKPSIFADTLRLPSSEARYELIQMEHHFCP